MVMVSVASVFPVDQATQTVVQSFSLSSLFVETMRPRRNEVGRRNCVWLMVVAQCYVGRICTYHAFEMSVIIMKAKLAF